MECRQIATTVDEVERFRFLEAEAHSMVRAAVAYPLSFPGCPPYCSAQRARRRPRDFRQIPGARLSAASLERVLAIQDALDAGDRRSPRSLAKRVFGRY